jgi:hypothetical protein
MSKQNKSENERKTSEKPVSLNPLDFEEALRALLATQPPTKQDDLQDDGKPPRKKKKSKTE